MAAGLGKQFDLSAVAQGFRGGSYEIRILDFKVLNEEGNTLDIDNLFKKPVIGYFLRTGM